MPLIIKHNGEPVAYLLDDVNDVASWFEKFRSMSVHTALRYWGYVVEYHPVIRIQVTQESQRPGFEPPEPDVQSYSTYENAAEGLVLQDLNRRLSEGGWGRREGGITYRVTLTEGDRPSFDEAMLAVASRRAAGYDLDRFDLGFTVE